MRMKTRSNSARPLHEQLLEEARARIKGAEADRQLQTPPLNDDVYLSSPASPDDVIDVVGTYHDEGLDDVIEELESYDSDYETVQIPSGYDDGQRRTMMGTEDHDYYASDGYTTDETVAYREEMDHEQRFDIESTDFIDVTSIDNDDDDYIVEMPEEEEDHASAYEQYMMHRVESEQEDEAAEAERETHEREMARRQREADAERARAAERDRLMIEKNRQFKEQHEGRKLERLRDALEREEAAMLLQTEGQHTQDRFQQSENEENERAAIAHMIDELRIREQRLRDMVAAREAQEADLLQQQQELLAARQKADAIRQERIKATKDSDDHPHSLALRYSRGCGVCLAANPRRRAVLIACGHMTCATCAEQMASTSTEFACPFCRKLTTYVKTFEDLEDAQEVRPTVVAPAPEARKRKIFVGPSRSLGEKRIRLMY